MCCAGGCCEVAIEGKPHCEYHAAKAAEREADRKARAKLGAPARIGSHLYKSAAWKRLRLFHLSRFPLCVECESVGLVVGATDVDHIKPHRGDRAIFFDQGNLQSLCKSCHSRKTAGETFHGRRSN
ncbi:MAG: HNH endonuclease [Alteromonadaceae bacterium]|nr:HNH endonuclease [Alteromonadaceae bacterium]